MSTFFERENYIRLSEDGTHLISTTRYGRFFKRTAEFDVFCDVNSRASNMRDSNMRDSNMDDARETTDEKSFAPLKKRWSDWPSDEPV